LLALPVLLLLLHLCQLLLLLPQTTSATSQGPLEQLAQQQQARCHQAQHHALQWHHLMLLALRKQLQVKFHLPLHRHHPLNCQAAQKQQPALHPVQPPVLLQHHHPLYCQAAHPLYCQTQLHQTLLLLLLPLQLLLRLQQPLAAAALKN
jgi:hypothetical protein